MRWVGSVQASSRSFSTTLCNGRPKPFSICSNKMRAGATNPLLVELPHETTLESRRFPLTQFQRRNPEYAILELKSGT